MQAPKFWYRSRSWQAILLSPLGRFMHGRLPDGRKMHVPLGLIFP
jgi:hypothetical protein